MFLALLAFTLVVPPELQKAGVHCAGASLTNRTQFPIVEVVLRGGQQSYPLRLPMPLAPHQTTTLVLPDARDLSIDAVILANRTLLGPDQGGRVAESQLRLQALRDSIRDLGKAMTSEDAAAEFFRPIARRKDTPYARERAAIAEFILAGLNDFDAAEVLAGLIETEREYPATQGVHR